MARKYEIDMTKGSILKSILLFALPLILSNILQLLYNAADTVVVGRWAGTHALAAIGATSSLNQLLINLFLGLSIGAGIVVSRKYGAGNKKRIYKTLWVGIGCTTVVGAVLGILCTIFSKPLLGIYITDSPDAIQFGIQRILITCLPYFILGIMEQLAALINGLGKAIYSAVNSFMGTWLLRVLWAAFVFPASKTLTVLYASYLISCNCLYNYK